MIPQQHEAVFLLTMHAIEPPGFYNESISIETNYQVRREGISNEQFEGFLSTRRLTSMSNIKSLMVRLN